MVTLKKCAAAMLAVSLVYLGYLCFTYFVVEEVSITSVLVGLVGWYFIGNPSVEKWKQFFLNTWENKK